jgi:eukaryotic-like serine/threonine-protein kinase
MRDREGAPGIETAATAAILQRRLFDPEAELYRIGRYAVLGQIGRGGMGTIYAAFDDDLDRRVAIKLLHATDEGDTGRLRREAQALAQLSHPNVVAVFEVGEHEGRTYVAMEHVRGETLRQWSASATRSTGELLAALLQAGRALAAAHAAAIVHRDFKPENVMVDEHGRVRVLDFGLAVRASASEAQAGVPLPGDDRDTPVSRSGRVAGTPGYIAPELVAGAAADARSDQFSFCVTAWEALAGSRPAVRTNPASGDPAASVPAGADGRARALPRALRRVLERGLARDPGARWPSMAALVDALERARARARRSTALVVAAVLACVPAAWSIYQRVAYDRRSAACERDAAAFAEQWPGVDDATRREVHEGLLATGVAYAADSAERVDAALDAYALTMQHARAELCGHQQLAQDWDAALVDSATRCLDERALVLGGLLARFRAAEPATMPAAVPAAASLPPVARCLDERELRRMPLLPREHLAEITAVREQLAQASAERMVAREDAALTLASAACEQAEALAWPPLLADARLALATSLGHTGEHARAEQLLVETYFDASAAGLSARAMNAASGLVGVVGERLRRFEDGLHWARLAELERVRIDDEDPVARKLLFAHLGALFVANGDYALALAYAELAHQLDRELNAEGSPESWNALNNIHAIRMRLGDVRGATAVAREMLAKSESLLGPDHPEVALACGALGGALQVAGDYEQARGYLERALALHEETLGADHPEVARMLTTLAIGASARGDLASARALDRRALDIWLEKLAPDHPMVSVGWNNLGSDELALGDYAAARHAFERTVELRERALGADHPELAKALTNLGGAEIELGRLAEARAHVMRALEIYARKPSVPRYAAVAPSVMLGEIELREHHWEPARVVLEHALTLEPDDQPIPALERALVRFPLARALWETRRDRVRAIALAREAIALLREHPDQAPRELAAAETWLAAHAP